jgi:predicted DNA-binding ribbon-helix-helix protein
MQRLPPCSGLIRTNSWATGKNVKLKNQWEQTCVSGVYVSMKSAVVKRSIVIAGHKTSISLEDAFWNALKDIAEARHTTAGNLIASIDLERDGGNLSSALRLFVLHHAIEKCSQPTEEPPTEAAV